MKKKILELENYVKFLNQANKQNIKIPNQNMHMVFTGNPGTGKTTIARIMAKILFNAGIIYENKLVEVSRKDLIAGYIGQTAIKTGEIIEKALGGVLFIDEAYSLVNKSSNDFASEAVETLIKNMEDYKGQLVVIFAGYKDKMHEFIESNPGIASRIGYTFHFPDYTREELAEILYNKIKSSNLKIESTCFNKISDLMNYFCNVDNIGNGRFVDKVFQEILIKHSQNLNNNLLTIKEIDIPSIKEMTKSLFNGNDMINPEEITNKSLEETATHEIGHAFVRYALYKNPGIIKITINPEGIGTLGYVQHKITDGAYTQTKTVLLNEIMVSLAGMASEEIFYGEFSNGNSSDLRHATYIAQNMITKYGMSSLGFGQIQNPDNTLSLKIESEINNILGDCYNEAKKIIKNNLSIIKKLVHFLLKEKEISENQFLNIINKE